MPRSMAFHIFPSQLSMLKKIFVQVTYFPTSRALFNRLCLAWDEPENPTISLVKHHWIFELEVLPAEVRLP
jgi:hypothetical protein